MANSSEIKKVALVFIATTLQISNPATILLALQVFFLKKVSDFAIALLLTIYWIPMLFLSPVWGYIADSLGNRKIVAVFTQFMVSILTFLFVIFPEYTQIFILRFLTAIFSAAYTPVIQAYLTEDTPPTIFGRRLAIYNTAVAAGFLLSGVLASILLYYLPTSYLFIFAGISSLCATLFLLFIPAEKIEKQKISLKRILVSIFSISVVFELKKFRAYYAIIGLGLRHTLIMGLFSLVYVYMQKMGIPKHLLGIASIFNNITQIILITVCGILADKIGRKTLFVPGFFFSAIIPVIFMFSRTFLDFAIAFAFIGFSYSLLISGINPYIRDIAPKGKESEVLSLVNTTRAIGSIFGPIIAGAIVTCFSYEMMFVIFFIVGIIATIFSLLCKETKGHGS